MSLDGIETGRWIVREMGGSGFVYVKAYKKRRLYDGYWKGYYISKVERVCTQKQATVFTSYEDAIIARRMLIRTNWCEAGKTPEQKKRRLDGCRIFRLVQR